MKNLMKKYDSAVENDDHFMVKDKKGAQFKIGKAMLGDELGAKLKKFADMSKKPEMPVQSFDDGGDVQPEADSVPVNVGASTDQAPPAALVNPHPGSQVISDNPQEMSSAQQAAVNPQALPYGVQPSDITAQSDDNAIPDNAPSDNQTSAAPSQPINQSQAPNPVLGQARSEYDQAIQAQQQAIDASQRAEAAKGQALANAGSTSLNEMNARLAEQQKVESALNAKGMQMFNAMSNPNNPDNKINPDRYWQDKNGWQKALAAISITMGGLAGGLQKNGSNVALDVINKAIQHDIDAQQANIQNKQSLYAKNLEATHNAQQAKMLTFAQMSTAMAARTQIAEGQAATPAAAARAAELKAQLLSGAAMQHRDFALTGMAMNPEGSNAGGVSTPGQPSQLANSIRMLKAMKDPRGEDLEKRLIPGGGPNGQDILASIPPSEAQRTELVARQNVEQQAQALRDFSAAHSGTLPTSGQNIAIINQGKAMANQFQNTLRTAAHAGVYKESEAEFMKKIASDDPTQLFSKFRTDPGYRQVQMNNQMELNNLKKSLGVNPANYSGSPSAPAQKFNSKPSK